MVTRTFASLLAIAGLAAGCGGGAPPTTAQQKPIDSPFTDTATAQGWTASGPRTPATPSPNAWAGPAQVVTGLQAQPTEQPSPLPVRPAGQPSASAAPVSLPTIPNGARFTIFCDAYTSPDHVAFATNVKNILVANTKLKDWYVVHQPNQSILFHGYYAEFDAKNAGKDAALRRDAERAQRDHGLVESIPNPTSPDQKMFPRSLFVPLDAPDPDAPPAWNLTNAPGFWTVQIAAFTGPERKQAAVESVRNARAANIPAFYYHGENVSSVCIGSWDRSAIKEQSTAQPGSVDFDRGARDESEMIINYAGQPLAADDPLTKRVGPDGKPIRVLQAKAEILDKTMIDTLRQYPEHAVDDRVQMIEGSDKRTGEKRMVPRPSFVVQIPRGGSSLAGATGSAGSTSRDPPPTLIAPNAARQDLGARLRGLGQ